MRMFVISDNNDTRVGMRLAGIEGVVVHEYEEVAQELEKVMADESIGIVLMTKKLITLCRDLVYDIKLNRRRPLIVEIPDRHGDSSIGDSITSYIQEAVGIRI
ncbi:MAG TPA: V-type ATP synthase subunit F [Candidatus Merdivicinus intestinavium]|nr:V-type ATP synthase subunit F [Candidatus Merdivicinus intestinavium]